MILREQQGINQRHVLHFHFYENLEAANLGTHLSHFRSYEQL